MVPALRKDVREDLAFFSGGCSRSSSCESRICVDFTRERGFFFEPKRFFGAAWLWFGYAYLAAMIARAILLWMNLSEPMTAVTDYILAGVTAWLCILLFKHRESQRCRFFWAVAFAALAVGAFLGGTWHGLVRSDVLWKATLVAVGIASCAMVAGSLFATLAGAVRNVLLWFAGGKFLLYLNSLVERSDFMVVIIDTGIAFAAVALLHLWRFNGWILLGIGVSVAAALVQASGFAVHEHFNHNDLYHVIQIAAMALLFRGVRRLRDATDPKPPPPAAGGQP